MTDLKTSLRIEAKTSGQDKVDQLKQALIGLGLGAEQAEAMAQGIAPELEKLGPARRSVEALKNSFMAFGLAETEAAKAAQIAIQQLENLDDKNKKVTKSSWDLSSVLKTAAAAAVVNRFIDVNASLESMEKSLELVTGSQTKATAEMAFVTAEAQRMGLEITSAANSYTQLAASAKGTSLEGKATRDIWTAVAEAMSRLGKSGADTEGALLAISQMMSKGTVQAEELRGQLGERLPGAFQAAARAMGTTTQGLDGMLQSGTILASEFLPKFAAELHKAGAGGGEIDTFNAQLNRAKTALAELFKAIGDTGLFNAISWVMGKTAAATSVLAESFSLLKARVTGNREETEKYSAMLLAASERLFGIRSAAKDAAAGLDLVGQAGAHAAGQVHTAIRDQLLKDLLKLKTDVGDVNTAFDNLGLDPAKIETGISKAERLIIDSFKRIAADPNVGGAKLMDGFLMALDQVDKVGLPELGFALTAAGNAGKISMDLVAAGLDAIKNKTNDTVSAADSLQSAYKELGIKSLESLQWTADGLKNAYDMLVAAKAPVEDLRYAWLKYAEAAMAAAVRAGNGQVEVARATLEAEAAAKGYIVTISDGGKVVGHTLDEWAAKYDQIAKAQDLARAKTQQAAADMAAQSAELNGFGKTAGKFIQDGINSFFADLKAMDEGMAWHINTMRAKFAEMGDWAEKYFNDTLSQTRNFFDRGGLLTLGPNSPLDRIRVFLSDIADKTVFWQEKLSSASASVDDVARATRFLADSAFDANAQVYYLGNERMQPMLNALAEAKQRMLDLESASRDTLSSIQDEFDQYYGNLEAMQKRQDAQRLAELGAKLAAAQAAGDREAIANLQKAIDLYKLLAAAKEADAAAQQRAQAASGDAKTAPSTGGGRISTGGSSASSPGIINNQNTATLQNAITFAPGAIQINAGMAGNPADLSRSFVDALANTLAPALAKQARLMQ